MSQELRGRTGVTLRLQQTLTTPVGRLVKRGAVTVGPTVPLHDALETMQQHGVGSIVVTDDGRRPLGIFTLHDLLARVALPRADSSLPVGDFMTGDPVTVSSRSSVYEAALTMVQRGFRHLPVVDGGTLVGVVSEKDLFQQQRVGISELADAVGSAASVEQLVAISEDVRAVGTELLDAGVAPENLTQLVASLNDLLTRRIVELEFASVPGLPERYCWLALGSEGRFEQTLVTDQDNGLVFVCAPADADARRRTLLLAAMRVNDALDRCGFPLCKGGVMAGNAACCMSLDEWKHRFDAWIAGGSPEGLLNASIYFDFRGLAADVSLATDLKSWLLDRVAASPLFLRLMTENALRTTPARGMLGGIVTDGVGADEHTVDLKLHGATPFIDAARIFSLAARIDETNTCRRLRAVAQAGLIGDAEVDAWVDAFLFIQVLRLRGQHTAMRAGRQPGNRVAPGSLNELELRLLKESMRQAALIQDRLRLDYAV